MTPIRRLRHRIHPYRIHRYCDACGTRHHVRRLERNQFCGHCAERWAA